MLVGQSHVSDVRLVVTLTLEMGVGGQSHVSDVMLVVTLTLEMGVEGKAMSVT